MRAAVPSVAAPRFCGVERPPVDWSPNDFRWVNGPLDSPNAPPPAGWRTGRRRRMTAFLASLACHLTAVLILAQAYYPLSRVDLPFGLNGRIAQVEPLLPVDAEITIDLAQTFDSGGSSPSDRGPISAITTPLPSNLAPEFGLLSNALTGAAGGGAGSGNGPAGDGVGDIGFFGTEGAAHSVIFIVDMSGSMEGARFGRARLELVRAIHKLEEFQTFHVIFFNSHTFPLFHPKPATTLVKATQLNKRRACRWIGFREPAAKTNPEPALRLGLAMKPDVIFLLTDGEIPESTVEAVRAANAGGTMVNTIAFQGREGETLLRLIAEQNRGTYRFVR